MSNLYVTPKIIKAYIGGQHKSICDSCGHITRCKKYERNKKVFYCDTNTPKAEQKRKKTPNNHSI